MFVMNKKYKVAILKGGNSDEHPISVRSGEQLKNRMEAYQNVTDIMVDRSGEWFVQGTPYDKRNLVRDFDMVINTMKGGEGEDGRLTKYLDAFGVKHTNASQFGSTLSHNKHKFKEFLKRHEIKTPHWVLIDGENDVEAQKRELHQKMFLPAVVKPATNGSSIGVFVAKNFDEMKQYVDWILKRDRFALVEEYIEGLDVSVLTTKNFRGQPVYSFIPVGVDTSDIINYDHKFNNTHTFFSVDKLTQEDRTMIEDIAKSVHTKLDLDTLAMTDFRVHPKRGVYALETNTVPSFEDGSIYDEALKLVGVQEQELVDHIINLAMNRNRK
jgi:D-alanine-D-alanine ligase